jgi:glycerophosphoryl diester phosphodiesterase
LAKKLFCGFFKDLKLVCSHEAWIKEVCDINDHLEFANRSTTYNMDDDDPNFNWNDKGDIKNNFFTIDFTLEELATLKRKQVNYFIDPNFNWQYSFATFDEFVTIAQSKNVGIAPEIKAPTAINKILKARGVDITTEELVLKSLGDHGYTSRDDKCLLQCFELSTLEKLKGRGLNDHFYFDLRSYPRSLLKK